MALWFGISIHFEMITVYSVFKSKLPPWWSLSYLPQTEPITSYLILQRHFVQISSLLLTIHGIPLQYSCLENPMDGGAWWAAVCGVAKSQTRPSDFTFTFHFHALEKEMATHSSVLAWRIPGTGEPGGLPSLGLHRVGHDWSDLAAAAYPNCLSGPWTYNWVQQTLLSQKSKWQRGSCLGHEVGLKQLSSSSSKLINPSTFAPPTSSGSSPVSFIQETKLDTMS